MLPVIKNKPYIPKFKNLKKLNNKNDIRRSRYNEKQKLKKIKRLYKKAKAKNNILKRKMKEQKAKKIWSNYKKSFEYLKQSEKAIEETKSFFPDIYNKKSTEDIIKEYFKKMKEKEHFPCKNLKDNVFMQLYG